jgi:hypothetical protein
LDCRGKVPFNKKRRPGRQGRRVISNLSQGPLQLL